MKPKTTIVVLMRVRYFQGQPFGRLCSVIAISGHILYYFVFHRFI